MDFTAFTHRLLSILSTSNLDLLSTRTLRKTIESENGISLRDVRKQFDAFVMGLLRSEEFREMIDKREVKGGEPSDRINSKKIKTPDIETSDRIERASGNVEIMSKNITSSEKKQSKTKKQLENQSRTNEIHVKKEGFSAVDIQMEQDAILAAIIAQQVITPKRTRKGKSVYKEDSSDLEEKKRKMKEKGVYTDFSADGEASRKRTKSSSNRKTKLASSTSRSNQKNNDSSESEESSSNESSNKRKVSSSASRNPKKSSRNNTSSDDDVSSKKPSNQRKATSSTSRKAINNSKQSSEESSDDDVTSSVSNRMVPSSSTRVKREEDSLSKEINVKTKNKSSSAKSKKNRDSSSVEEEVKSERKSRSTPTKSKRKRTASPSSSGLHAPCILSSELAAFLLADSLPRVYKL